jgi:starvation-inducible DNA-binding protein
MLLTLTSAPLHERISLVATTRQNGTTASAEAQLQLHQRGRIIQEAGTVRNMPLGLDAKARLENATALNQILVDTITLYNMYKKHHWQVAGHTFYQLHLLFDKHAAEQLELVDALAERIQLLGGVAIGMPHDVAERTKIERPPLGVEEVPVMIDRLLEAHELILKETRELADKAEENGDSGTNDLLVSEVVRTNELQVWFVGEHVVDTPAVDAKTPNK